MYRYTRNNRNKTRVVLHMRSPGPNYKIRRFLPIAMSINGETIPTVGKSKTIKKDDSHRRVRRDSMLSQRPKFSREPSVTPKQIVRSSIQSFTHRVFETFDVT